MSTKAQTFIQECTRGVITLALVSALAACGSSSDDPPDQPLNDRPSDMNGTPNDNTGNEQPQPGNEQPELEPPAEPEPSAAPGPQPEPPTNTPVSDDLRPENAREFVVSVLTAIDSAIFFAANVPIALTASLEPNLSCGTYRIKW